jgi:hypothetical protein
MPLKTKQLLEMAGVSEFQLRAALRGGKLKPPPKDASGDYCWRPEDVEALRQAVTDNRRQGPRRAA